jgi:hypothetical protein
MGSLHSSGKRRRIGRSSVEAELSAYGLREARHDVESKPLAHGHKMGSITHSIYPGRNGLCNEARLHYLFVARSRY